MNGNLVREDKYENYLLVEGSDDKHVFYHLLGYYQILKQFEIKNENFAIKDHEGVDNLLNLKKLRTYLKVGEPRRRFGIVIDADIDLLARWQRLRIILEDSGYRTVPINPVSEGTIVAEEGLPIVGVWLMPNNKLPGMLEDFVSFLIPPADLLWPLAEGILPKVIETDRRFPLMQTIKAHIHTWLAWQEEPGKPMGQAITKRYLDATAPRAQQLMDWLRKLFDLESV